MILRSSIYSLLGLLGHEKTVEIFNAQFDDYVKNQGPIDPDIRSAVYSTVCCHGDMRIFDQMKKLHAACDSADEVSRLLIAMGKCRDPSVKENVLKFSISVSL